MRFFRSVLRKILFLRHCLLIRVPFKRVQSALRYILIFCAAGCFHLPFIPKRQYPEFCAFGFGLSLLGGGMAEMGAEESDLVFIIHSGLGATSPSQRSSWDRWPDLQLPPLSSISEAARLQHPVRLLSLLAQGPSTLASSNIQGEHVRFLQSPVPKCSNFIRLLFVNGFERFVIKYLLPSWAI